MSICFRLGFYLSKTFSAMFNPTVCPCYDSIIFLIRVLVPWIAYLALFAFDTVLPPRRHGSEDVQIKNSNLGNWKDMALYLGDAVIAVPFWEQFFRIYFTVQERYNDSSYFTQQTKQPLNDHFMSMASRFQTDQTKPFYQMYYSFTTWAKDVIL